MATNDVPGANPANRDKLTRGCWGEHEDGSLIYVLDVDENGRVVFNIYDFKSKDQPVFYPSALSMQDFSETFSYNPKKKNKKKDIADIKWTWHDKTPFPWDKVMKIIDTPQPQYADVSHTLSAAQRIAQSLQSKVMHVLDRDSAIEHSGKEIREAGNTGKTIMTRLRNAISELVG